MTTKHIFDLDNTLVYTNEANNDAYNMALIQLGMKPIEGVERITREIVFEKYSNLTDLQRCRIVEKKQELFPLEKTRTNKDLLWFVRQIGRDNCFVWSGADPMRGRAILRYHEMETLFADVQFSKKENITQELFELSRCLGISLQDITIYEDIDEYIIELRNIGITVIDAKTWRPADVIGQEAVFLPDSL